MLLCDLDPITWTDIKRISLSSHEDIQLRLNYRFAADNKSGIVNHTKYTTFRKSQAQISHKEVHFVISDKPVYHPNHNKWASRGTEILLTYTATSHPRSRMRTLLDIPN
ncbi:hypothetical protein AVEN_103942-1 [Araneus ventricosus]|uniref:Uncharacterized protein n=1 Tax=Araneus ventricosus TaxID=182803 RepID=A0A4Y2I712_ARAVE|nr:hypothetical protein AVEN_103942-1 [Araneus ventricosus]